MASPADITQPTNSQEPVLSTDFPKWTQVQGGLITEKPRTEVVGQRAVLLSAAMTPGPHEEMSWCPPLAPNTHHFPLPAIWPQSGCPRMSHALMSLGHHPDDLCQTHSSSRAGTNQVSPTAYSCQAPKLRIGRFIYLLFLCITNQKKKNKYIMV